MPPIAPPAPCLSSYAVGNLAAFTVVSAKLTVPMHRPITRSEAFTLIGMMVVS